MTIHKKCWKWAYVHAIGTMLCDEVATYEVEMFNEDLPDFKGVYWCSACAADLALWLVPWNHLYRWRSLYSGDWVQF
jgi:hypothetical protein